MALFQKSVLTEYLKKQDSIAVEKAYKKFVKYFYNPITQKNIRDINEEGFQQKFLMELFVNCFGYVINPDPYYNLTTEFKNLKDAKKADGAILIDGKAIAVIELKGTNTKNLEKCRQQAFDYKSNHPTCKYIITSNFEKLRFYIDTSDEFEEFNLFTLTENQFALLYLCVFEENLLNNIPFEIKKASSQKEEAITKKLYSDYSYFRKEIFNDLINSNPEYDKLLLFNKTQKLLDRFLFIFFGEDRGLIPANSIGAIINKWEEDKSFYGDRTLFEVFKGYFNVLNVGRPARGEKQAIFAYNGGLFAEDEILNKLKIDDNILLKHTKNLSHYDFESDISVNILGHIFENSLSEIEEIQNQISGLETGTSKRKKDGVFYTPQFITKYIVDNTVGKLCSEKKNELDINEETYAPSNKRSIKRIRALENYRNWLLRLTICDPACGSGAFLNQALGFLIDEHKYIDELSASYNKDSLLLSDVENSILENNLFGVDINGESVEIAKLSLWLRTAKKGRKLTSLNNNLKCGNSLIDDPEVAGDKAFNWEKEFPEVLADGGFDVVVGNPPYVRQELINKIDKDWLSKNYDTGNGTADLYIYFYEMSISILKKDGLLGFITPNKFYKVKYGKELRVFLKQFNVIELIDFFELKVFADASTDSQILILNKQKAVTPFSYCPIKSIQNFRDNQYDKIKVSLKELDDDIWIFNNIIDKKILSKISLEAMSLNEYTNEGVYRGITTGRNEAFIIGKLTRNQLIKEDKKCENFIKPYINSIDIYSWHIKNKGEKFLLHIPWNFEIEKHPSIKRHLEKFKEDLSKRPEVIEGRYKWFAMSRYASDYHQLFSLPKIIYIHTAVKHQFYFDESGLFINNSCYLISNSDKFLAVWLNSSVFKFYKKLNFVAYGDSSVKGRAKLDYNKMVNTPIPNISDDEKKLFTEKADIMINYNKEFQIISNKFVELLKSDFSLEKMSKKIENWHSFNWNEFEKELEKNKIIISGIQKEEWYERFTRLKEEAQSIKYQIDQTDNEIDQIVYELYGLTKEEIEIVENSI